MTAPPRPGDMSTGTRDASTGLPRVFFDGNNGLPGSEVLYWLGFVGSRRDLAAIPGGPKEGMRVLIDDGEGLEMQALLRHDPQSGQWLAKPIPGTTRDY